MSELKLKRVKVNNPEDHRHSAFRYLNIDRKRGLPIFLRSKVGSCSRVINEKGVRKAVPLYLKTEPNSEYGRGYGSLKTTTE